MSQDTPAAKWRESGEKDPHEGMYDCKRSELTLGNLTDDELANEVFMNGDNRPSMQEILDETAKMPIVYLTAGKDRIRWLSRQLVKVQQQNDQLAEALGTAKSGLLWYQSEYPDQVNGCDDEAMQLIDAALEAAGGEA